ncbi:hypothetical protein MCANUFG1_02825 [Mycoplasmopsis canis UFG1]|uniref:hypothetical protein n=1 Tax=Mycoplasmopsis canis TaxID=29555 RepID=UPI00025B08BB|nr:hypothetical protein [Mycoplasmopsis canis]EIE41246.1 hypothetical protein MCANUFG1_02825 [Mycoplasmopsis canis UFG1]
MKKIKKPFYLLTLASSSILLPVTISCATPNEIKNPKAKKEEQPNDHAKDPAKPLNPAPADKETESPVKKEKEEAKKLPSIESLTKDDASVDLNPHLDKNKFEEPIFEDPTKKEEQPTEPIQNARGTDEEIGARKLTEDELSKLDVNNINPHFDKIETLDIDLDPAKTELELIKEAEEESKKLPTLNTLPKDDLSINLNPHFKAEEFGEPILEKEAEPTYDAIPNATGTDEEIGARKLTEDELSKLDVNNPNPLITEPENVDIELDPLKDKEEREKAEKEAENLPLLENLDKDTNTTLNPHLNTSNLDVPIIEPTEPVVEPKKETKPTIIYGYLGNVVDPEDVNPESLNPITEPGDNNTVDLELDE